MNFAKFQRTPPLQKTSGRLLLYISNHQITKTLHLDYYFSEFTEYTGHLFSELKLLKVQDIFSLIKLLFRIDFINDKFPEELKIVFVINRFIYSHETLSSMVSNIPKAKMSRLGLNILRYDGANLRNEFYHVVLYKIPKSKAKFKKIRQLHFLD